MEMINVVSFEIHQGSLFTEKERRVHEFHILSGDLKFDHCKDLLESRDAHHLAWAGFLSSAHKLRAVCGM